MRTQPWTLVSTAIVMAVAGIVLFAGLFSGVQDGPLAVLDLIQAYFLQIGVILAGAALLVGAGNLASVHFRRLGGGSGSTRLSSLVVLGGMLIAFLFGAVDYALGSTGNPESSWLLRLLDWVIVPIEASLMAVLSVGLLYAGVRLLTRRQDGFTLVFLGVALLTLAGSAADVPFISDALRPWLLDVPVMAGARGLLIGVALGAIASGLRVFLGAERPYGS